MSEKILFGQFALSSKWHIFSEEFIGQKIGFASLGVGYVHTETKGRAFLASDVSFVFRYFMRFLGLSCKNSAMPQMA